VEGPSLIDRPEKINLEYITLSEQIYRTLYDAIIDQALAPGSHINSHDLAHKLGVSRTIIVEALFRLRQEGLIGYAERLGFFVSRATADELSDLLSARLMCEVYGIRKGLANASEQKIAPILAGLGTCQTVIDQELGFVEWARANCSFHLAIVQLSDNNRIHNWYKHLWELTIRPRMSLRWRPLLNLDGFPGLQAEHHQIRDSILRKDVPQTLAILHLHMKNMLARASGSKESIDSLVKAGRGQ
jgi:DNA-binding GntR family transcriptional regulator